MNEKVHLTNRRFLHKKSNKHFDGQLKKRSRNFELNPDYLTNNYINSKIQTQLESSINPSLQPKFLLEYNKNMKEKILKKEGTWVGEKDLYWIPAEFESLN